LRFLARVSTFWVRRVCQFHHSGRRERFYRINNLRGLRFGIGACIRELSPRLVHVCASSTTRPCFQSSHSPHSHMGSWNNIVTSNHPKSSSPVRGLAGYCPQQTISRIVINQTSRNRITPPRSPSFPDAFLLFSPDKTLQQHVNMMELLHGCDNARIAFWPVARPIPSVRRTWRAALTMR